MEWSPNLTKTLCTYQHDADTCSGNEYNWKVKLDRKKTQKYENLDLFALHSFSRTCNNTKLMNKAETLATFIMYVRNAKCFLFSIFSFQTIKIFNDYFY